MKNSIRARRRAAMKSRARVLANATGKRCRTFGVGCIICSCWHHFDMRGFFPRSFDDANQYNKTLADMHGYETDGVAWADAGKYGPDAYNQTMDDVATTMAKNNLSSEQWDALTSAQQTALMEELT